MCDSNEDMAELIQHLQEQRAMIKAQAHRLSVLINRTREKHNKKLRYQQDEEFRRKLKERSQQAYHDKKAQAQQQAAAALSPE
jgi:type IV secretory pathway TraG/TraD family ATPase VirD4